MAGVDILCDPLGLAAGGKGVPSGRGALKIRGESRSRRDAYKEVRALNCRHRVLIVDSHEDSREALRTILECRGMEIFDAARFEEGRVMARTHDPDLIVVDIEDRGDAKPRSGGFDTTTGSQPPVIILGMAKRQVPQVPPGRFVSKPYHFAPLIRKIESLLAETQRKAA